MPPVIIRLTLIDLFYIYKKKGGVTFDKISIFDYLGT